MKKLIACLLAVILVVTGSPTSFAAQESMSSEEMEELLEKYAPIIWYSEAETTWPSSLEEMQECAAVLNRGVVYTKPWSQLSGDLNRAKCYAFFCEKSDGSVSLVYWQYYMRDCGKFMLGSHYGDWEHCSVRLIKTDGIWTPVEFSMNYHGINQKTAWSELQLSGNHPIVYAAKESHGIYLNAGKHRYYSYLYFLFDLTDSGTKWETQNHLESYRLTVTGKMSSIHGANHRQLFVSIKQWGQSINSPSGPLDREGMSDPTIFQ